LGEKTAFRILKSISCKQVRRHDTCDWYLVEELSEHVDYDFYRGKSGLYPEDAKNNGTYKIAARNITHDYETGHIDGYDVVLEECKHPPVSRYTHVLPPKTK